MKRWLMSLAAIAGFALLAIGIATAQPVTTGARTRLRTDCTTGYGMTWSGSTWACAQLLAASSGKFYYTGTAPSVSGCPATVDSYSTDHRGKVVTSDTNGTNCTVTFTSAWSTNAPACVISSTLGNTQLVSTSTTTFVFNNTATQSVWFHCDGML